MKTTVAEGISSRENKRKQKTVQTMVCESKTWDPAGRQEENHEVWKKVDINK